MPCIDFGEACNRLLVFASDERSRAADRRSRREQDSMPEGAMVRTRTVVHDAECRASRPTRQHRRMSPPSDREARTTVFVIDDDATVCKALERLLRSAGFDVETFTSAEDFLERDPRPASGALILDVSMPGMSGPELQARLAALDSDLRIVFITAIDDERVRNAVLAAGAQHWFTKPIDDAALLAALGAERAKRSIRRTSS
jgi:CheY-like chemotaxis protein